MKAPEVTPRNQVGSAKVPEIFTSNYPNYHPDRTHVCARAADTKQNTKLRYFCLSARSTSQSVICEIIVETIVIKREEREREILPTLIILESDKRLLANRANRVETITQTMSNYIQRQTRGRDTWLCGETCCTVIRHRHLSSIKIPRLRRRSHLCGLYDD